MMKDGCKLNILQESTLAIVPLFVFRVVKLRKWQLFGEFKISQGYRAIFHSLHCITKCALQGAKQAMSITIFPSFNLQSHGKKLMPGPLKQKLRDNLK